MSIINNQFIRSIDNLIQIDFVELRYARAQQYLDYLSATCAHHASLLGGQHGLVRGGHLSIYFKDCKTTAPVKQIANVKVNGVAASKSQRPYPPIFAMNTTYLEGIYGRIIKNGTIQQGVYANGRVIFAEYENAGDPNDRVATFLAEICRYAGELVATTRAA